MQNYIIAIIIAVKFAIIAHYVTATHYQQERLGLYQERAELAFRFATLIEQSCEVKIDLGQAYQQALRETFERLGLLGQNTAKTSALMAVLNAYDKPAGIGGSDDAEPPALD